MRAKYWSGNLKEETTRKA